MHFPFEHVQLNRPKAIKLLDLNMLLVGSCAYKPMCRSAVPCHTKPPWNHQVQLKTDIEAGQPQPRMVVAC